MVAGLDLQVLVVLRDQDLLGLLDKRLRRLVQGEEEVYATRSSIGDMPRFATSTRASLTDSAFLSGSSA